MVSRRSGRSRTAFLPIAGADGAYLGLVLDETLLAAGQAPIVYYSHEHDPMYTWLFASCADAVPVLEAAEKRQPPKSVARGVEHETVTAFLREMSDPEDAHTLAKSRALSRRWPWEGPLADDLAHVFEGAGNSFAVRHVSAQQTWRTFEEKIRAARPAHG